MALTTATNYTGASYAFDRAGADTDAFDRAHLAILAAAVDDHTHGSGLGLGVTRLGAVTAVTSIAALVPISVAGLGLRVTNTSDSASVQTVVLQGDRATMAANDEAYLSLQLSDSAGNQDEFGRLTWVGTTVTSTSEEGQLRFGVAVAGTLTDKLRLSGTALAPSANDGLTLGTTSLGFADLHLATGGVINWANSEITITETDANTLTIAGVATRIDVAAGILELNNAVEWDTGVAVVAAEYSVGRDADGTNQLHFNVPTGATFEWSVNDTAEATLSATALNLSSGNVYQINATDVLSATTLGSGVTASSLTSVGTLTALTMGGAINCANNVISNIGAAGTDFTATGGLTLADVLTVSAGGITVTGNSTITGTLGGLTGLTVASGVVTTNDVTLVRGGATTPPTGAGVEILYSAAGYMRAYNRTTSAYVNLILNDTLTIVGSNGLSTFGGAVALGANNLTMTGTISATGARVTQSYHTNITSTNAVTVDSSLRSKVPGSIVDYAGDALGIIRAMRVVGYQHLSSLDPSNRTKLGIIAETVGEPLALQQIDAPGGGAYPGINLMALLALQARAIQQLDQCLAVLIGAA